jgi:hypothetical protein
MAWHGMVGLTIDYPLPRSIQLHLSQRRHPARIPPPRQIRLFELVHEALLACFWVVG